MYKKKPNKNVINQFNLSIPYNLICLNLKKTKRVNTQYFIRTKEKISSSFWSQWWIPLHTAVKILVQINILFVWRTSPTLKCFQFFSKTEKSMEACLPIRCIQKCPIWQMCMHDSHGAVTHVVTHERHSAIMLLVGASFKPGLRWRSYWAPK